MPGSFTGLAIATEPRCSHTDSQVPEFVHRFGNCNRTPVFAYRLAGARVRSPVWQLQPKTVPRRAASTCTPSADSLNPWRPDCAPPRGQHLHTVSRLAQPMAPGLCPAARPAPASATQRAARKIRKSVEFDRPSRRSATQRAARKIRKSVEFDRPSRRSATQRAARKIRLSQSSARLTTRHLATTHARTNKLSQSSARLTTRHLATTHARTNKLSQSSARLTTRASVGPGAAAAALAQSRRASAGVPASAPVRPQLP